MPPLLAAAARVSLSEVGLIDTSRVARKNGRMAGERRRAYRQYGRAFRHTSRPFFPQPEGTRVFWPPAASLVAHGLFKPTSLLAPGQKPKSPASRPRDY